MTRTSSETWSERGAGAGAAADILDLDRYMRTTRPARRPALAHKNSDQLVVDCGAVGHAAPRAVPRAVSRGSNSTTNSNSDSETDVDSAVSRQNKRFSHDSGLSDTSYQRKRPQRRSRTGTQARDVARSCAGTARRRGSESNHTLRATLERALRDQQAQIARVAQLCEQQAQRNSERPGERRSEQPSERQSQRRAKRPERPGSASRNRTRTPSDSTGLSSSSSSSRDPHKHRSDCRTYKIIMSKLDELNRLFAARRAPAPQPPRPALALRRDSSGSVTVSDKVVGTDSPHHTVRQACAAESERGAGCGTGCGAGRGAPCVVAYALSVDIPPRPNVVTESVVRSDEPADETAPGGFHLDDPVKLYQQAKRLEAKCVRRVSSSGSSPRGSSLGSGKGSCKGSCKGSAKGSTKTPAPSLCALCRCYWSILRRYVTEQLSAVRE